MTFLTKFKMTNTMTSLKQMAFLVAVFTMAVFVIASVSANAFGEITSIEVDDVEALPSGSVNVAAFAGQKVEVRTIFEAADGIDSIRDVRVNVWIVGDREFSSSSPRFVVDSGKSYSRTVLLEIPFDLDPSEDLEIKVSVESKNDGVLDEKTVNLGAQRESYVVEVLDVDMPTQVKAGETLVLDVVLKNRGREEAEDTFVRGSIPALGISDKGFFGDLSAEDQDDPEKFDSGERRVLLKIPANTPAGIYVVEVEAFNADSITTVTQKVSVVGAGEGSIVASPVTSRTFGVGESGTYSLTIVNTGERVAVYELIPNAPTELKVELSEPIVAIPAGTSKTVQLMASSEKEDGYSFTVDINSDGQIVDSKTFRANVEGSGTRVVAGNTTVLLTVILAIIFVVLLVVLIVLLTRKPEKSEEFGESYY